MNQFVKKCIWFLAIIVLVNVAYLGILMVLSPGFKKVYEVHSFKNQNFDLLIFGNSMALDGIDSEYLQKQGISNYNMAIAGDHISSSKMMLEAYLKNNKKPKIVAIGLSSAIGKSYLNDQPFKNPEIEFFYHPSLTEIISNPPLLNFQWLAVDILKILMSADHRQAQMVLGQWKTKKIIADNSDYKSQKAEPILYTNPYLAQIVSICAQNQIKVLLLELPGSNARRNDFPYVSEVTLSDGQKCIVHNLNNFQTSQSILDADKDWLAADHLNQFGGQKVTAYWYQTVLKPLFSTSKPQ
ncbi:hypothetical protein KIH23_03915 [Flavobacterium sp. CYK-55]|uniref:hypothetical protein n=1 Tax=Flavobacterium sp. CYK-55 TaxID=2835529 RepID=UPI001BD0D2C1|nr:hypothetical protein [Flavobacterium sp. CYK-55]MBS7786433.1 hypothetical protein [Flavobacterium sp. CYK-55]